MDTGRGAGAVMETVRDGGRTVLVVRGDLDADSTPELWKRSRALGADRPSEIDASGVTSCDSAGAAWLLSVGAPVKGASERVDALLRLLTPGQRPPPPPPASQTEPELVLRMGAWLARVLSDTKDLVVYTGTLVEGLALAVRRPSSLRKKDVVLYMQRTGSQALPIVALIGFLIGLIVAYQAAEQLQPRGFDAYVADAVAMGLAMELSPLMTAIVMAGRSGSAFAAEIGTMKVNEEVDALDTMGLDSARFLVMPKVVALLLMMPLLVTFATWAGITGGLLIGWLKLDQSVGAYLDQTVSALTMWRVAQGYVKAQCYAVVIAAIGCRRGLQTKSGAQGVGLSATSAVVDGIFLIIVVDAVLTVIFNTVTS